MNRAQNQQSQEGQRSALIALCGFVTGVLVGGGLTLALRYAIGAHAGVTPWLQSIANVALVIAALFAGWAAFIARSSFRSQRSTAQRQLELANDEAARLIAADESRRHHAAIDLLWRFMEKWESDEMLRWRAELADGLIQRHMSGGELAPRSRFAFGEIANFIDFAGYCARRDLLAIDDIQSQFSYYWELYWAECRDQLAPDAPDPAGDWEDASWLMGRLGALEPGGVPLNLRTSAMLDFLKGERDVAKVDRAVRQAAVEPSDAPATGPKQTFLPALRRALDRYTH